MFKNLNKKCEQNLLSLIKMEELRFPYLSRLRTLKLSKRLKTFLSSKTHINTQLDFLFPFSLKYILLSILHKI